MAEAFHADEVDEIEKCIVCCNYYNDNENCPKYLDCHHMFCLFCIEVKSCSQKKIK